MHGMVLNLIGIISMLILGLLVHTNKRVPILIGIAILMLVLGLLIDQRGTIFVMMLQEGIILVLQVRETCQVILQQGGLQVHHPGIMWLLLTLLLLVHQVGEVPRQVTLQ